MQNTSEITTVAPQKGLVTDLHENLVSKEVWTYARNAQMNSHIGQIQFLQNEPSTKDCVTLPYKAIGFIKLLGSEWVAFSTDDVNSEIGIFDENLCTYRTLVNDPCLNFNSSYLVKGVSKEMFDCTQTIYWTDAYNPRRTMNINKIPRKFKINDDACASKTFTDEIDCDQILMEKKITIPKVTGSLSLSGNLKNGVYQFGVAYAANNGRISDFYSITSPIPIWSHENFGQSITLNIENLDREFDQYELLVIYTIDSTTFYKSLGFYSTGVNNVQVTNVDRPEYTPVSIDEIVIGRPRYPYADNIVSNDQYLLWSGVKTTQELNYQPQAMNIEAEYVVYRVPDDYYQKGGTFVGYCRDEVYAFGIQWLYDNGDWSPVYHIPGLKDEGTAKSLASGKNVYEVETQPNPETRELVYKWEASNTAGTFTPARADTDTPYIGTGKMAYWQSSETYPNNIMYGDDKCTAIRHHKFPSNNITHHYENGGGFIHILGIQFNKVEHPKDHDGNYISNIVGYRIVRGDRRGNRSIIAKGFLTNVRSYKEGDQEFLFPNYPYNDLREDHFLSSRQTENKSSEQGYTPLKDFKKDQFNFYSPHTLFTNVALGEELNILTEEIGSSSGFFEKVYKHPRAKLLTQTDLYFALVIGAIDGFLSTRGKRTYVNVKRKTPMAADIFASASFTGTFPSLTLQNTGTLGTGSGTITAGQQLTVTDRSIKIQDRRQLEEVTDSIVTGINSIDLKDSPLKFLVKALITLAQFGMFAYFSLQAAQDVLDTISELSPWQDYALQYNSKADFLEYKSIPEDNRRRHVDYYQYLYDGINTVNGVTFNNFRRENSVYLSINDSIVEPSTKDKSRNTMTDLKACDRIGQNFVSPATIYYGQIKRKIKNQYGQLEGITYLDTGMGINELVNKEPIGSKYIFYNSQPTFGGDTFISKFSIKRSHNLFTQTAYDVPDGFIFDYRSYRNVAYPRYWINTTPYDLSGIISQSPTRSKTPRNSYNLNCDGNGSSNGLTVVQNKYFFTSINGVITGYVESEYNLDFRDFKEQTPNFYSKYNQNLSQIFRSDKIDDREEFVYDVTYSKPLLENTIIPQSVLFDPEVQSTCYTYLKNRVIYSLPAFKDQKRDNWLVYLSNNKHDFPLSDFGRLTSMHSVDNQQIMFLFDQTSPYITIGRDELQLDGSGKTITLGDGGLFARDPRPLLYTDFHYGNSQSSMAFVNTQFGSFYPSQRQGRIFNWKGNSFEEITKYGMHFWFKNYLPCKLLEDFPNYKLIDNPIKGIGLLSIFDNKNEVYYLCKRDVALKPEWKGLIRYDEEKDKFYNSFLEVELSDRTIFEDCSWTISFDPKTQSFISFHDWFPDLTLQSENHFMTVKGDKIWKHNERTDSFCQFYNVDYPFELEYLVNNGQNNEVLRSIEYFLDCGKYYNGGRDFHQILDDNFDTVVVSNMEQVSGYLKPILQSKKDMSQFLEYPLIDTLNGNIKVLYNKEEQKIRINQFWDITKDRGEYSHVALPLWTTSPNGYIKTINEKAVDYTKRDQLQKKFRNLFHKIFLSKSKSGDRKYIFKFSNNKQVNSPR